jgi:hypothetical protein
MRSTGLPYLYEQAQPFTGKQAKGEIQMPECPHFPFKYLGSIAKSDSSMVCNPEKG